MRRHFQRFLKAIVCLELLYLLQEDVRTNFINQENLKKSIKKYIQLFNFFIFLFLFNSHFAHSSVCWQTFAIEVALKLRSENDVNLRIFEHIASTFLRIFSFSGIFQRDLNIFLLPEPHDLVLEPKRKQFNITLRYVYNLLSRRGEAGKT